MEKEENIPFKIILDYWDVENGLIIIKQKTLIFVLMAQNKRLYRRRKLYQLKFKILSSKPTLFYYQLYY